MKVTVKDNPPIPKEVKNPETLAFFLADSLGLIPERGKGDVVIELLLLFTRIAGVREGVIEEGGKEFHIKNGAMKARDILEYLRLRGHSVSQSQFYVTYLNRFLEAGLITKKKGSRYGLRGPTLVVVLDEVLSDIRRVWAKITEHAGRLERTLSEA